MSADKIDGISTHFPNFVGCSFAHNKVSCVFEPFCPFTRNCPSVTCVLILTVCFSLCNVIINGA